MSRLVIVNGRCLDRQITGVERYANNILKRLPGPLRVHKPPSSSLRGMGQIWEQVVLPLAVPDQAILWSPANSGPISCQGQAVTIHDLSPLDQPRGFTAGYVWWMRLLLPILTRRVEKILTVSQFSRSRIQERLGIPSQKIFVIPPGVDRQVFHPVDDAEAERVRQRYGLPSMYLLFVGSLNGRKNLNDLLLAWQSLFPHYPQARLVLVGTGGPTFRRLDLPGAWAGVSMTGYIPDGDLPGLYSRACATVCLSNYEGFCLTGLEAMACGCPVIAADIPAFREALGDAGRFVTPGESREIIDTLEDALNPASWIDDYRRRGLAQAERFTWEASARGVWQVLQEQA